MRPEKVKTLLILEAIACATAAIVLGWSQKPLLWAIQPLTRLAVLLRKLSLSGGIGNALACALYVMVCLLPLIWVVIKRKRGPYKLVDCLCAVASAILFCGVYLLINPALLTSRMGEYATASLAGLAITMCVCSLLGGYWLLNLLGRVFEGEKETAAHYMYAFIATIVAIIVFRVCAIDLHTLATLLSAGAGFSGGTVYTLRYIAGIIPSIFALRLLQDGATLLTTMKRTPFDEALSTHAKTIAHDAMKCARASIGAMIFVNLLQLLAARGLFAAEAILAMNYELYVPLLPIGLCLIMLLLSRYFGEAKAIKDDNDMFV